MSVSPDKLHHLVEEHLSVGDVNAADMLQNYFEARCTVVCLECIWFRIEDGKSVYVLGGRLLTLIDDCKDMQIKAIEWIFNQIRKRGKAVLLDIVESVYVSAYLLLKHTLLELPPNKNLSAEINMFINRRRIQVFFGRWRFLFVATDGLSLDINDCFFVLDWFFCYHLVVDAASACWIVKQWLHIWVKLELCRLKNWISYRFFHQVYFALPDNFHQRVLKRDHQLLLSFNWWSFWGVSFQLL